MSWSPPSSSTGAGTLASGCRVEVRRSRSHATRPQGATSTRWPGAGHWKRRGSRIKATPAGPQIPIPAHCRVRQDAIDTGASVTLRYRSKLYHIGVGRRHAGTKVIILVADLDVRILTPNGTLPRQLTLAPARNYQPQRLPARP